MGFKYGSLIEDFYTGFRLKCEGWRSTFCNPKRPAFLGDAPISLIDALYQCQRWMIGGLQVAFCKFRPITFGVRSVGPLVGLAYTNYSFWSFWFVPLTIYAFLPQLALLNGLTIFPKVCMQPNKFSSQTLSITLIFLFPKVCSDNRLMWHVITGFPFVFFKWLT
jgi:cellulose synthase/poly-beta-1,6-N-acetylglucosamine synthase-like glycosyltransferase